VLFISVINCNLWNLLQVISLASLTDEERRKHPTATFDLLIRLFGSQPLM
jgi:hypothetical protein